MNTRIPDPVLMYLSAVDMTIDDDEGNHKLASRMERLHGDDFVHTYKDCEIDWHWFDDMASAWLYYTEMQCRPIHSIGLYLDDAYDGAPYCVAVRWT